MNKYIFNARDIAAYFKWFSVPSHLEVTYMQYFFSMGTDVIATPLTRDFELFKKEVYRELYYLWANGFEDDKSDISCIPPKDALAVICDQECINLESYMKLITLHLIFSRYLPYVKINFMGLPLSLGIRCDFSVYEKNVLKAINTLNLTSSDAFGKPFNLEMGVPDELLLIGLDKEFKKKINGENDFRMVLRRSEKAMMDELREKSFAIEKKLQSDKETKGVLGRFFSKDESHGQAKNGVTLEKAVQTRKIEPKGAPFGNLGGSSKGKK